MLARSNMNDFFVIFRCIYFWLMTTTTIDYYIRQHIIQTKTMDSKKWWNKEGERRRKKNGWVVWNFQFHQHQLYQWTIPYAIIYQDIGMLRIHGFVWWLFMPLWKWKKRRRKREESERREKKKNYMVEAEKANRNGFWIGSFICLLHMDTHTHKIA